MNNVRKNTHGFSLIEMLVSIAVLAFIGVLALQIFLTAERSNQKAERLDKAVSIAVDTIEQMKAWSFEHETMDISVYDLFPEGTIDQNTENNRCILFYDKTGKILSKTQVDMQFYRTEITVSPEMSNHAVCTVNIGVFLRTQNKDELLYELNGILPSSWEGEVAK